MSNEVPGFPDWLPGKPQSLEELKRIDAEARRLEGTARLDGTEIDVLGDAGAIPYDGGEYKLKGFVAVITGQDTASLTRYSFAEAYTVAGSSTTIPVTGGHVFSDSTTYSAYEANGDESVQAGAVVLMYPADDPDTWFFFAPTGADTAVFNGGVVSGDVTFAGDVLFSSDSVTLSAATVTVNNASVWSWASDSTVTYCGYWDWCGSATIDFDGTTVLNFPSSGGPAGSNYLVQYYDTGSFGADAGMNYEKNGGALTLARGDVGGSGTRGLDITRDESTDAYPAGIRLQKTNGSAGACTTSEAVGSIQCFAATGFTRKIVALEAKTSSGDATSGYLDIQTAKAGAMGSRITVDEDKLGFFAASPVAKPTVTGSRGGNAALASLLTALANLGLITDSSS